MPRKVVHKAQKSEKTVVFKSEMNLNPPEKGFFTPTEREIIMADIAFLKQQEIESGDWAKWQKSQKPYLGRRSVPVVNMDSAPSRTSMEMPMPITEEMFSYCVGRLPINDELDRCNCSEAGTTGHRSCGWCRDHNKPIFMCGCWRVNR